MIAPVKEPYTHSVFKSSGKHSIYNVHNFCTSKVWKIVRKGGVHNSRSRDSKQFLAVAKGQCKSGQMRQGQGVVGPMPSLIAAGTDANNTRGRKHGSMLCTSAHPPYVCYVVQGEGVPMPRVTRVCLPTLLLSRLLIFLATLLISRAAVICK